MPTLYGQMAIKQKGDSKDMESLDKPPSYTVRKESLGRHKKFWVVREKFGKKRVATVMGSRAEACTWVMIRQKR